MTTKESEAEKMCLICASDYHLEMILLPYIKSRLNSSKFIIFTENNLEDSLKILLTKTNLKDNVKKQIENLNWTNEDKINELKKEIGEGKDLNIIINGSYNYIKNINDKIKEFRYEYIKTIDCFHVNDSQVNIEDINQNYKYILNTRKI